MDIQPRRSEFPEATFCRRASRRWCGPSYRLTWIRRFQSTLKLGQERRFSALLESVQGGAVRGRYSFIALDPDLVWRCRGQVAEMCRTIGDGPLQYTREPEPTLTSLRALVAATRIALPEHLPPMAAGLIGYMGYDTIRLVENIPDKNPDSIGIPDGMFMRPMLTVIFDNVNDIMTVVTPVYPTAGTDGAAAYADATRRIHGLLAALERPVPHVAPATTMRFEEAVSNIGRDGYHAMVRKAKEYILAGDIFQVVPSQRFRLPFALPAFALYRSLRRLNPSPFLFHSELRRLRYRRIEPGNPRASARRQGHHTADRGHPEAR